MSRRIVVTGLGMVSSLGHDVPATWRGALAGCSGVARIMAHDVSNSPVKVAAEVKNWQPERYMDIRTARRTDRHQQFIFAATTEAMQQSGLIVSDANRARVTVMIGVATGGFLTYDENMKVLAESGARRVNPFGVMMVMVNGAAAMISIAYGAQGPSFSIVSSCATGADNIGQAFRLIQSGQADAAICGGGESPITEMGIASLDRINTLSHIEEPPETACAPFDRSRCGLVLGEGAAILVLEALETAQARGANILAELTGYGASMDGYHISAPDENGSGAVLAMNRALTDAQIDASTIDYINTHGTGTQVGDVIETRALKRVFGSAIYDIAIDSTKPLTGHGMGATSAMEAIFCIQAIRDGAIPPTLNLHDPDPECDLDYTPLVAGHRPIHRAMTNALGLGGHNASLIFSEFSL